MTAAVRREHAQFDVTPVVVRSDEVSTIEIKPVSDCCAFESEKDYVVTYFPSETYATWVMDENETVHRSEDGVLRVTQSFAGEQEHVLVVEEDAGGERRKQVGDFRVYSLHEDLFTRRPYKGDFHTHSCRSDGRDSPGHVAAACRRVGCDFMAVTDHRLYEPSIEAQQEYAGVDIDLAIFPGEEASPPRSYVDIVSLGGRSSVSKLCADEAVCLPEVQALARTIGRVPDGVDLFEYAACVWCCDRIREAGGLSIFCHPYGFWEKRWSQPTFALTAHLLATRPFDAVELLSGYSRENMAYNNLIRAHYAEELLRGRQHAIVSASDTHGCEDDELFGCRYTLVFARALDLAGVTEAVKGLFSVVVEALPGEAPRVHGPLRLVKYTLFLLRELMPRHDELCAGEGRLMLEHVQRDTGAARKLSSLSGRASAWLRRCYGEEWEW